MHKQTLHSQQDLDLRRATLQIEQKRIFLNLRENVRGRYLRIAEVTGNNRSTIIVPSSGLLQFRALLDDFIENDSAVVMGQQAMLADGVCVRLYTFIFGYTRERTHAHSRTHTRTCKNMNTHKHAYTRARAHAHALSQTHTRTQMQTNARTHTHTHTYIHTYSIAKCWYQARASR